MLHAYAADGVGEQLKVATGNQQVRGAAAIVFAVRGMLPGPMDAINAPVLEALLDDEAATGGHHDVGPQIAADRELVRYGHSGEIPYGGHLRADPKRQDVADLWSDVDRPGCRYHGDGTCQQRGNEAGEQRGPE